MSSVLVPGAVSIVIVFNADELEMENESDERITYGDYSSVEVYFDTEKVQVYGDHYHDKGQQKAESFVSGARHAWKGALDIDVPPPTVTNRVDRTSSPSTTPSPV